MAVRICPDVFRVTRFTRRWTLPPMSSVAFISYSRCDSDFVLGLAKALQKEGCNVWVDQLSLDPGTRWDEEIMDALSRSSHFIVILSPASASSRTVLDEINLALDKRKNVIPVLYRNCDIPFRLRRIQHIDIQTDFAGGVERLIRALGPAGTTGTVRAITSSPELVVEVVDDFAEAKELVEAATSILELRIPPGRRHDRESFVDLVRDNLPNRPDSAFKMYLLSASYGSRCLGMLLGWEDIKANFGFISYLAATKTRFLGQPEGVSKQLAKGLIGARARLGLTTPPRFIFEVEDPAQSEDRKERRRRLSRLKLFDELAPFEGVHFRILDLKYLEPSFDWPPSERERQLLLGCAAPGLHSWLPKAEAVEILTWVYTQLYEGRAFQDLSIRAAFQTRNRELLDSLVRELPDQVGLMRYRDIKQRCGEI